MNSNINIQPYITWCQKHWEIIYLKELNGIFATLRLLNALLGSEKFMRRCGWSPELGMPAEAKKINIEIQRLGCPPCCWLGDEVVNKVIAECEALKKGEFKT